jgi:hypothetical protein
MTRYDNLMDGTTPKPTTKMMRIVDAQGYHLRWIEVSVEDKKAAALLANAAAERPK